MTKNNIPAEADNSTKGLSKRKIEALAEALVAYSGYLEPGGPLHDARNPGGLKALGMFQARDEKGNRVFRSVLDGYQALIYDLSLKLSGKARVKLSSDSALAELAAAYNLPATTAGAWAKFLRKALHTEGLSAQTKLSFFQE